MIVLAIATQSKNGYVHIIEIIREILNIVPHFYFGIIEDFEGTTHIFNVFILDYYGSNKSEF